MAIQVEPDVRSEGSSLRMAVNSPVFTGSFASLIDSPPDCRRLVEVKAPVGMVDMFGRPYPRRVALWVHHFDDYGVIVEGTYEVTLARRALKKVGYDPGLSGVWAYRPIVVGQEAGSWPYGALVGGRSSVAFYFEVANGMS